VIAASGCTFKYGGGFTDTTTKGVAIDSLAGLAIFERCRADANWSDGFNAHNNYAATGALFMTVNSSAIDNGRAGSVSNNGWTMHEDVKGIDLAGYYERNRGGTIRSINGSKNYLAGTTVKDDLGDQYANGVIPPTAFQVDNNAEMWVDRTKVLQAAGSRAYVAAGGGSAIHQRDVYEHAGLVGGVGTIDSW
jgi:hypothetical protein